MSKRFDFDMRKAYALTEAQANGIENKLLKRPNNVSARSMLLVFYHRFRSRSSRTRDLYRTHLTFLIRHSPRCDVLSTGPAHVLLSDDRELLDSVNRLWLDQLASNPGDSRILRNAGLFFLHNDLDEAEPLFLQGMEIEPTDSFWPHHLSQVYSPKRQVFADRAHSAATALAYLERAIGLASNKIEHFALLNEAGAFAFESGDLVKAKKYADDLLAESNKIAKNWNTGNAIHKANIVLGRLALISGNIAQATQYLLNAGLTPGSPQLNSFGPNMLLAKELIEAGERKSVVEYFNRCRTFWVMGTTRLDEWTARVNAGEIPNFGPNLVY